MPLAKKKERSKLSEVILFCFQRRKVVEVLLLVFYNLICLKITIKQRRTNQNSTQGEIYSCRFEESIIIWIKMTDSREKSSKENKPNMYKCKVCYINFDDIHEYTEHLESKAHEKELMKKKYGEKYLEAKEMLDEKSNKNKADDSKSKAKEIVVKNSKEKLNPKENKNEEEDSDEDDDENEVYTCDKCRKICTGMLNYKLHLAGNKHRKKVRQLKLMKKSEKMNCDPSDYTAPDMDILNEIMPKKMFKASERVCELCNVSCSGPEVLIQHLKGEAHKKREAMGVMRKQMEGGGISLIKKEHGDMYQCELCKKAFSGLVPYSQHMESINHLKQERDLKIREKMKNQFVVSPENSKIKCKECNKVFSGSSQFEEHLKGPFHEKLKKKENLYEELKKKFPEMVETKLNDESDSDSEGECAKPACGVCHVIFSGPEAARDHFTSEKHKKALKKKKIIEKNNAVKKTQKQLKKMTLSETKGNSDEKDSSSDCDFEKISG